MKIRVQRQFFIKEKHLLLELVVPKIFERAKPGQFVHIRVEDSCDPLLRRPLSIHDISPGRQRDSLICRILYEIVGKGTAILAKKKSDNTLDLLGPQGNGFDMKKLARASEIYLVAGGMGVAPLFFLAKKIAEIRNPKSEIQKITVLIGGRTKEHVLCEKDFKALGCDVHVSTDDGSKGYRGRVTELLKERLRGAKGGERRAIICACGPKPMLAVLAGIGQERGVGVYVSLEEFMGCGLGACLGCVIRTTSGYKRICHDGPVFDANEIIWKD